MLRSLAEDGHMQHGPQARAVGGGNIMMSVMEGRTEPGGDGSGKHRPLEPNINLTQTTKTSSYPRCDSLGIADRTAEKAASIPISQEISMARGKQFTLPGEVSTTLLPRFNAQTAPTGPGSDRYDGFGTNSFYYPAGSPLCKSLAKHKWHHNPSQAAATLHKLQEFDAQGNILVLAAHDESLLDLDPSLLFPRGTLNNWFKEGLKDEVHWTFLADFVGAITVGADICRAEVCDKERREKGALGSTKEERGRADDSLEPTALGAGMSRDDHHNLMLLKTRWETRKDYWGPVGLEGV